FLVLGSVFLVVTGGEALYADMGHFGRLPIKRAWFAIVLPALVINYFGQGALLLSNPEAIENPFYLLAPSWAQLPMTVLATMATVIASQALISGAFSLTVQAVNIGYLPRIRYVQTSDEHQGQVYVPSINWFLLGSCVMLVFAFGSSTRLAAAYGVAVTLTMIITTALTASVARNSWGWSTPTIVAVFAPLFAVDLAFAGANVFKIPSGGWFPLVVGVAGFLIFTTWRKGRRIVAGRVERRDLSIDTFVESLRGHDVNRHPGTGVYLHRTPGRVPPALLANLKANESLHESIVLLTVITEDRPKVVPAERIEVVDRGLGFHQVVMHYGYSDRPTVGPDLAHHDVPGLDFDPDRTTYFLGRERIKVTERPGMALWREHLFSFLLRNSGDPAMFFELPPARTVDIGTHIDI
ncbi:MAG: KUP/HAK/KT family potassium transporter, partial [Acidimicrobiia bacterium]|nr:KUP/HAK/KT family potassium transporter [Acidimicrobiia bacterium]